MIHLLLPAYNEEDSLPPLLESVASFFAMLRVPYRVVVVDDGSSDATAAAAERAAARMPVTLLRHEVNQGLGAAMRTGLTAIAEEAADDDLIVAMDADNTHSPALIAEMEAAIGNGADIVIASRYAPGGEEIGLTPLRMFLSRSASLVLRLFFPIRGARDYTCGYRMYRASSVKDALDAYGDAFITERGFVCMAEILIRMARIGCRVAEVGCVLRYDRKGGASKMKFARTILRYFCFIWSETVARKTPSPAGEREGLAASST